MWIYLETERAAVYTVGHYNRGNFEAESDHDTRADASQRVNFLNGGNVSDLEHITTQLENIVEKIDRLTGGG